MSPRKGNGGPVKGTDAPERGTAARLVRGTEDSVTRIGPLLIAQNPFNCTRAFHGFNCRARVGP